MLCLLAVAACNKKTDTENTAWTLGTDNFAGTTAIRADNAMMVKNTGTSSFIYARFAPGKVNSGPYTVVAGEPTAPNEISFSVSRNGENYVSSASGNPSVMVTVVNEKLNILISNVWMLHLPRKQDSLLLDAVMIEQ